MDDKMKFILALSAGAALLMIGADWLKKVDLPAAKAPDPEVMTILDKPPVVKRSKKKSRVKPTTEWIRRDKLGIRAMALRPRGKSIPLKVDVQEKQAGCRFGDMDYIRMDHDMSRKGRLLLTLEPVNGTGKKWVRKVSMKDLQARNWEVELPAPRKKPVYYGLFLCADDDRRRSCRDKKPARLEKIENAWAKFSRKKRGKKRMNNHTYVFSLLRLGPNYVETVPTGHAKLREMRTVATGVSDTKLRRWNRLSNTLRSIPPVLTQGTVRVGLTTIEESCRFTKGLAPQFRR